MDALVVIRVIVQVVAILTLLTGFGLVTVGVNSSSWQTYTDSSISEIHQHGLWFDYTWSKQTQVAGSDFRWIFKPKFGPSTIGDEGHRAQEYQINTLILLIISVLLCACGLFCSCCACVWPVAAIGWVLSSLFATLLSAIGLGVFYFAAMEPEHRFTTTDRKIAVEVGQAFYISIYGVALYAIGTVLAICSSIILCLTARNKNSVRTRTYPRPTQTPVTKTPRANTSV